MGRGDGLRFGISGFRDSGFRVEPLRRVSGSGLRG